MADNSYGENFFEGFIADKKLREVLLLVFANDNSGGEVYANNSLNISTILF